MSMVMDKRFEELYHRYFDGKDDHTVLDEINAYAILFNSYDPDLAHDVVNIMTTGAILNATYLTCENEILEKVGKHKTFDEETEKACFCMVLKCLIGQGHKDLEKYVRFPRDIYKEVAAAHFKLPEEVISGSMKDTVKKLSYSEGYSLEDEAIDNWDEYYFNVCRQAARKSKCFSRHIGAVIVKDKRIISTGYNGPAESVPRCDFRWKLDPIFAEKYLKGSIEEAKGKCPRKVLGAGSGVRSDLCLAAHAEENAIVSAARQGISVHGGTMYMTCGVPCVRCLNMIINSGIKEIVVISLGEYDESDLYVLTQSNLKIRLYNFIGVK